MKRRRSLVTWCLGPVLGAMLLFWGLQYALLPGTSQFRNKILSADRLELQTFLTYTKREPITLAMVTKREDIEAVAESLDLRGVWWPDSTRYVQSYRIKAISGEASSEIVIMGRFVLTRGDWFVRVAPSLMDTFDRLVAESGSSIPSHSDLRHPLPETTSEKNQVQP